MSEESAFIRAYWPGGALRSEVPRVGGYPNGVFRSWYESGALELETEVRDGVEVGSGRQWSETGKLLGVYQLRDGRGLIQRWHQNGRLASELSLVEHQMTGRQRVWDEDGALLATAFWIRGRQVSQRKYEAACDYDAALPRYTSLRRERRAPPRRSATARGSETARRMSVGVGEVEAIDWLSAVPPGRIRTIGESSTMHDSIELVSEIYELGGCAVLLRDVDSNDQDATVDRVIVRLPGTPAERARIFAWASEQVGLHGYDPEVDQGQEEIVVGFA